MGDETQKFTSTALSSLYPSYYEEFQLINWTHVDLVITKANGDQIPLPRTGEIRETDACVVIEYRDYNGLRITSDKLKQSALPIDGSRTRIPFERFKSFPIRIEEHNIILSTVDQSIIAKNMINEDTYNSSLSENRTDMDITDPRLVFQVIDPYNQWDAIMVHVFGQTLILRAGQYGQFIPSDKTESNVMPDKGKLVCYLRYPTDYFNAAKSVQTVFEISLNELDKKEPYQLSSGDFVCIATNMQDLQEVVAKRASCSRGNHQSILSDKMISKDIYDAAVANFKKEQERLKEEARVKLETMTVNKNNEIAKLSFQIQQLIEQKEVAESKARQWEGINTASTVVRVNEAKVMAEVEKARKESAEASKKDLDKMWTALGCCGSLLVGALSFAATVYSKSKK